jgi:hypothetical protein
MAFREGIAYSDIDAMVERFRTSADAVEGIPARLAKREPRFLGKSRWSPCETRKREHSKAMRRLATHSMLMAMRGSTK